MSDSRPTLPPHSAPTPLQIFAAFLGLGATSFGGGPTSLLVMQRSIVDTKRWISEPEFTRIWSLCQLAPGITLLGVPILIGWQLRRWPGAFAAAMGLLLPSALITVVLAALYARVRNDPTVAAGLKGVVPATIGLGLLTAYNLGGPLIKRSRAESRFSFGLTVALLIGCAAAAIVGVSVPVTLLGAGTIGSVLHWRFRPRPSVAIEENA